MSQSNEEILCSLQRQVALLRRTLSAVVAVMLIALLCAAVVPEEISDVIRAHKIVVVNKSGQRMVELSYAEEGSFAGDPQISEMIQTSEHLSEVGGVISTFTPCSEQPTALLASGFAGGGLQLNSNLGSIVLDAQATLDAQANNILGGNLSVYSANEPNQVQVSLKAAKNGGSVYAHNLNGDVVAGLQSESDQSGELGIFNRSQQGVISLEAAEHGGRVHVHSNTGKILASVMSTPNGGAVSAHNLNGDAVGLLQSGSDQSGELGIFNRFQKQIVTLSDSNDYGRMAIHSNAGKPSLLFGVNQGGGSIAGLDFAGKVKFQFGLEKDIGSKLGKPSSLPKDSE